MYWRANEVCHGAKEHQIICPLRSFAPNVLIAPQCAINIPGQKDALVQTPTSPANYNPADYWQPDFERLW
jgi:hypothetical protein